MSAKPIRLSPNDDMATVHQLLMDEFAYMIGVIDPPSSLLRMTPADFARAAAEAELWAIRDPHPVACMVLTPKTDHLYLGKLAVASNRRGSGLARVMIDTAAKRARALNLPRIVLQTRVELTGNHRAFRALGFAEIGRTAHAGYDRPTSITFARDLG